MGPKMRIILANYSAGQLSARSICDLAFAIGSANSQEGQKAGRSRHIHTHARQFVLDKKITSPKAESMCVIALAAPHLQW
jgi:hypothetical protein